MLTLLHTSHSHVGRFDRLRDRIAPDLPMRHEVHEAWLARALSEGVTPALRAELQIAVETAKGPVICTCTTLGPAAERLGAIRIDRPLMQEAVRVSAGKPIVLAYCLESAGTSSRDILVQEIQKAGGDVDTIQMLPMTDLWPLFTGGDTDVFARQIGARIKAAVPAGATIGAIVLAQASMDGAAREIEGIGHVVLSPPETALRSVLQTA